MKKVLLFLTAALAAAAFLNSCVHNNEPEYPENAVYKVGQSALVDAAAAAYAKWEEDTVLPETLVVEGVSITKAGEVTLSAPQYQYALAKALTAIAEGKKDDIVVLNYKPATHPDRDSYDKKEIPVTDGEALQEGTEDLVSLASRFIAAIEAEKNTTIPNQTLVTRKGADALAFSTNRLTVSLLRALAEYKKAGSLPKTISTDYLSAAATLKGFAQQFVKILEIWENTVGTVSADGNHCTDNGNAWQNVHFVPIPHSGGAYADGVDQYDAKYQPYFTVEIDGTTYTSAQTWGIALRGIMDLLTKEGSAVKQKNRNPFEHTMGNGASLKEPIPVIYDYDIWGQYPWYEKLDEGQPINKTEFTPFLIARCAAWFLTRQEQLGKIGNFQIFGTDPDNGFVEEGVDGFVCSMRMWLIAARFYKYLLDNNITENVYDAVKDVTFSTDLYGVEMPDITLSTQSVSLASAGTEVSAVFSAKKAWTATASESWIHVNPASGEAGTNVTIKISADENKGAAREGVVVIKGGNVTDGLEIAVTQAQYVDPSSISLKDFAKEFVKGLDVWAATVGTVESENKHLIEKGTAWENVHFIPVGKTGGEYDNHAGNQHDDKYTVWVLNVGDKQFTSAQAWEIATRGLLDMVLTDGQDYIGKMTSRNKPGYTHGDNKSFSELMTAVPSEYAKWNAYPWYEEDGCTYNGQPIKEVGVDMITKATLGHLVRGLVGIPGVFNPLKAIGNFQQFGSDDSCLMLEGYEGLISPMRELILLMRVYKYILDNNIDKNVYSALKDVKFDYDMYHQGESPAPTVSLKDFAAEFVKGLDVWQATVGTVESEGQHLIEKGTAWENVHFIPVVPNPACEYLNHAGNQYDPMYTPWKFSVKGTEYSSSQAWEIAIRGLLNMVTAEGEEFLDGMTDRNKAYTLQDNLALSKAPVSTPSADNQWGKHPWYEGGDDERLTYNGGPVESVDVNFIVKVGAWHVVRSFIKVGSNNPLGMIGNFQQFGTDSGSLNLTGYSGLIAPMRELIVLMRIYKYLLDNNIDSNVYTAIKDKKFDFDMYHQGETPSTEVTLKDFAEEFVKGLDVWEATVGTVESEGQHLIEKGTAWENAHFIPVVPNPACEYLSHAGNQYDPKYTPWKLNVKGTEYSSSQAWEIAIRGLLNMVTAEGEEFLDGMTDRNKAYTLQDNLALSKAPVSTPSADNQWGKHPWYEGGDDERLTYNGGPVESVDVNFIVKVGAWHVVRSFIKVGSNNPLGMIGNFQQFGTASGTLILDGYSGLIAPMRELMVLMRIYKYLLDNQIDSNVYTAIKDQKFDFDLYGIKAAAASIKIDGDMSDWANIEGVSNGNYGMFKATSDDTNLYFYALRSPTGRYSEIWNADYNSAGYIYFGFDLDGNETNGVSLWGNGPYDYIGVIFPYGASSPNFNEDLHGACLPESCTLKNVVLKGEVTDAGTAVEFSIPRADLPAIPATPISITSWGNKDLSKVVLKCTL